MKHSVLVLALASASIALPVSARAADDFCSRLIIQAVNQFCQLLPNGLNLCQPVALVGPNPECTTAERQAPFTVPLGPASMQPPSPWATPYAGGWPTTQAAAGIPHATRIVVPAPARPATPPESPSISAEIPKPISITAPVVPAIAATVVAAPPAASVAIAPLPPVAAAAPRVAPPVTTAPSVIPAPLATASGTPVAETPPPSITPTTQIVASPVVESGPPPSPVVEATPTPTAPAGAPPIVPEVAPPPASQAAATEEGVVDALAHFDFDSATLTAAGRAVLDAWLAEAPRNKAIRVSGFADRLGPEPYNLKLSLRRAEVVKHYLAGQGYDPRKIQLEAKGEAEPVKRCKGDATPTTKACLAPNRRVRIDPE